MERSKRTRRAPKRLGDYEEGMIRLVRKIQKTSKKRERQIQEQQV